MHGHSLVSTPVHVVLFLRYLLTIMDLMSRHLQLHIMFRVILSRSFIANDECRANIPLVRSLIDTVPAAHVPLYHSIRSTSVCISICGRIVPIFYFSCNTHSKTIYEFLLQRLYYEILRPRSTSVAPSSLDMFISIRFISRAMTRNNACFSNLLRASRPQVLQLISASAYLAVHSCYHCGK